MIILFLPPLDPNFVRCVKPNSIQAKANFESKLVQEQLSYLGMLSTIRVRQQVRKMQKRKKNMNEIKKERNKETNKRKRIIL